MQSGRPGRPVVVITALDGLSGFADSARHRTQHATMTSAADGGRRGRTYGTYCLRRRAGYFEVLNLVPKYPGT